MKRLTDCLKHRLNRAVTTLAVAASCALALGACGSLPERASAKGDAGASEIRGALLVVRLAGRLAPPATVQVDVAPAAGGPLTSLSARRQQSVPGAHADYFVALALPPQAYLITAIREGGGATNAPSETLAAPNLAFEVKPGVPAYLGRLVLTPDAALSGSLAAEDRYEEDTLFFRTALPALRELAIPRDLIALATGPRPASGPQLSMDTVDPAAATSNTLRGPAREAFQRYMKTKAPRAFAISDTDSRSFAFFSGERAVERAIKECNRRVAGAACRLYAVDDTLVSALADTDRPP